MKRTSLALMAVAGAILLAASQTGAAAWYAKFDGVDGSVAHAGQGGWFEIDSVQWLSGGPNLDALRPGATATGGPGVLQFSHRPGPSSPHLRRAFETKQRFPRIRLDIPKPSQSQEKYLKIHLEDAIISSFSKGSSAFPTETIKLNFTKIEYKAPAEAPTSLQAKPAVKQ